MEQPLCRIVKKLMSNKRDEQDCHHTQIFQLASLVSHGYDGFSQIFSSPVQCKSAQRAK